MNAPVPIFSDAGQAALTYGARGWHVFPAPPGRKESYTSKKSNGARWGASCDPGALRATFARYPDACLGIACQESGIFVIEGDVKGDVNGVQWLADRFEEHGGRPETVEALSPSGSWHIYFRYPDDFDPKTCQGEMAPGVDVRGHGGMVIAPPSVRPGADKPYRWKNPPGRFDVADCPDWLLQIVPRRDVVTTTAKPRAGLSGGGFKGIEDYKRLILAAGEDGKKHAATRDLAASLAAQGVKEVFAAGLIRAVCPVWDDNLQKSIASAYEKFRGNGFRHTGLDLVRDDKDRPVWNTANAELLLTEHPDWRGVLGFNAFTGRRVVLSPIPGTGSGGRDLDDDDYTAATGWFNRNGFPKATETITTPAVRRACRANTFDPLADYLNGLVWDRTKRTATWLMDYGGAEDTRFNREAGARWLISAVARALEPGVKVDHMLVLEGDQGAGKSSGIRALAGGDAMFGDNLPDMTTKDAQEYVRGKWIIEVAELVAARREINAVKAFISRQTDEFRWSYGREVVQQPRRCAFIGTTNDDKYLRDETGNRRFWPVRIDRMDVARLAEDRDQLWAEAVELYGRGTQWWLSLEAEAQAKDVQAARLDVDPWHEDVAGFVQGREAVSPREIIVAGLGKDVTTITRKDSDRVCGILRTLGFERQGKVSSGTFKATPRYVRRAS